MRPRRVCPEKEALYFIASGKDKDTFQKTFINKEKGYGVIATQDIEPGEFLLEYVGRHITGLEGETLFKEYSDAHAAFLYFYPFAGNTFCVDGTGETARLGRFINDNHIKPNSKIRILRGTAPDVLVIHCGGNDLGSVKSVTLLRAMKRDLHGLHKQFPQMKIMLSSINQRRQWRHALTAKMDKVRKFINNVMATFVLEVNGSTVQHPNIVFDKPELFLRDNVHLSQKGSEIFFNDIAQGFKDYFMSG